MDPVCCQALVIGATALGELAAIVREFDRLGVRRSKAGAFLDRIVPVGSPYTVGFAAPRLPAEHRRIPANAKRVAKC